MATGDDALAAGMDLVLGTYQAKDLDLFDNQTRDYLANGHTFWKPSLAPLPIAKGGSGAATADAARNAFGAVKQSGGDIQLRWDQATLNWVPSINGTATSPLLRRDQGDSLYQPKSGGGAYLPLSGGTVTGDLKLPNAVPATMSYVVCYLNGDGRISRGSSARKYKKNIRDARLASLFGPQLREFQYRAAEDAEYHVGLIADELAEDDATARFVVRDEDGEIESYDMIGLLLGMVYELQARVKTVEARG